LGATEKWHGIPRLQPVVMLVSLKGARLTTISALIKKKNMNPKEDSWLVVLTILKNMKVNGKNYISHI